MLSQEHTATRQLLAGLPPEQRVALVHLLTCTSCQRLMASQVVASALTGGRAGRSGKAGGRSTAELAVATLDDAGTLRVPILAQTAAPGAGHAEERTLAGWPLGEAGGPRAAEASGDAAVPERVDTRGEAFLAARELAEELLRLAPAARRREAADKAAYGDARVVRLLVHEAEAAGVAGEREAVEVAELAVALAERQAPPPHAHVGRLLAAALLRAARERARFGQELFAEVHYARLAALLSPAAVRGWTGERARLCEGLAQLRWRQGRLDEAAALFHRASLLMLGEQDERSAALARAQLGLVLIEGGSGDGLMSAVWNLGTARAQLACEAPVLRARIVLALAFSLTATGEGKEGAKLLREEPALVGRALPPGSGEALAERWWRARIAAVGGQAEEGARELDALRIDLLGRGSVAEAVGVTVDLVEVSAGLGQKLPGGLAEDLLSAFGEGGVEGFARRVREAEALPGERLRQVAMPLIAGLRSEVWRLRGRAAGRPRAMRTFADLVDAARTGFE